MQSSCRSVSETVETIKTGIVKFLGSGLLPEMEVALQLLIAAADTRHGVFCTSDIQNWQLNGVIDWNDLELVRKIRIRLKLMPEDTLVLLQTAGQNVSLMVTVTDSRLVPINIASIHVMEPVALIQSVLSETICRSASVQEVMMGIHLGSEQDNRSYITYRRTTKIHVFPVHVEQMQDAHQQ